jgi:hypothetical protein
MLLVFAAIIVTTCPVGEGCNIPVPNQPKTGPAPQPRLFSRTLIASFTPTPTTPPSGQPRGTGTR